ncbi:hypothetical protein CDD83_7555 [Cordyceps sp. RAO-2017]|nr:hypothetical protein CDD83_7555 [Cordyceps sp. RAO-2017]
MSASYLPLGDAHISRSFRLVKILRGDEGSVLKCRLKHFSIHQAPPYRAISYTWGNPFAVGERNDTTELEKVLVDDGPVTVSKSVASALKAMRNWHPAGTDWVWADAICIDQANVYERGQQVVLMSQIYSQAESVFVWLGPSTEDSDVAIDFLADLARDRRLPGARKAILAKASDSRNQEKWKALSTFMARRWWSRAWVLQESVLARQLTFACGKRLSPGDEIIDGFGATEDFRDKIYDILASQHSIALNVHSGNVINGMSRMRAARLMGNAFSMQICHFRSMSAQATDPRDYIYAKLGLASDGHFVQPDYTKEVQQTYRDFVVGYVQASRSLDIIYFDARPRKTPLLPSWVPDWNASYGAQHLGRETTVSIAADVPPTRQELPDQAAHDGVARLDCSGSDCLSRLVVSGCFCDAVDGVAAAGEAGWQGVEVARPMLQSCESGSAYGDDKATYDALWRTLVANQDPEGRRAEPITGSILAAATEGDRIVDPTSGPRFSSYYENVRHLRVAGKSVDEWMSWARTSLPSPAFSVAQQIEAEISLVDVCYFRRLFTTTRGFFGVGPCETEPGDRVCVLRGSRLPVVLRRAPRVASGPADDESGDWSLVGACYVHGIQVGELVTINMV